MTFQILYRIAVCIRTLQFICISCLNQLHAKGQGRKEKYGNECFDENIVDCTVVSDRKSQSTLITLFHLILFVDIGIAVGEVASYFWQVCVNEVFLLILAP